MAEKKKREEVQLAPSSSGSVMSMPSAIVAILVAFALGALVGNVIGRNSSAEGEEIAMADRDHGGRGGEGAGAAPAGDGSDQTRYRIDVSDQMPQRGPDNALVTIVMWSDYQCPFCSRVEPTLARITEQFRDQVRIVWRDQPLPFHQNAMPAAEAAREAYAQGGDQKFWQMHDLLFENQQNLTRETLDRLAQQVGLDMTRYRAAMDGHTHQATIRADSEAGNRIGANGTPAFFINGRELMGAQPFEEFQRVINEEIAHANEMLRNGTPRAQLFQAIVRNGRTQAAAPEGQGAAQKAAPPARPQPDPRAVYKVPVGNSPVLGAADALVTVVVFSDFECPFCARVEPTLASLRERYGRDIRFVWKHMPLPFHQKAVPASEAAQEAMAQQGHAGFWRFHDALFVENRPNDILERPSLERIAQAQGLNMARFRAALDNHTHQAFIEADKTLARRSLPTARRTSSSTASASSARSRSRRFTAARRSRDHRSASARRRWHAARARVRGDHWQRRDRARVPGWRRRRRGSPGSRVPIRTALHGRAEPPRALPRRRQRARRDRALQRLPVPLLLAREPLARRSGSTYGDRVKIVWRDYPLPFHQNAMPAAQAAREAMAQQGNAGYWRFHDAIFAEQAQLSGEGGSRVPRAHRAGAGREHGPVPCSPRQQRAPGGRAGGHGRRARGWRADRHAVVLHQRPPPPGCAADRRVHRGDRPCARRGSGASGRGAPRGALIPPSPLGPRGR
jgi:protein-disulfide isomerase